MFLFVFAKIYMYLCFKKKVYKREEYINAMRYILVVPMTATKKATEIVK